MALDQISNIPAGGIAAQTLQDAINELDAEAAKLATEQTWTAQKIPFSGILTDAATITWDCNVQGQVVKVTLAGNRTLAAPTNVREFAVYIISVNQDATGGRTLTWNAAFKFQQGTAPTLNTAANSNNTFVFVGGPAGALYSADLFYNQSLNTTNSPTFAGVTADAVTIGVSAANIITTSSGNLVLDSATGTTQIDDNLTVTGNLTVSGTTTTVNSTTMTVADPIITLGGATAPTVDDNKDRGVEFRWHNGTVAKVGFFGFDDSTGKLVFIPDATNTSEVFTGTKGTIDANVEWADVLNKPDPVITLGGDLTGSVTLTDLGSGTLTATIAANSVALGTDTTGNYVASVANGSYLTGGAAGSEGAALTLGVDATSTNTASKVVARDLNGDFSARIITATGFTSTASIGTAPLTVTSTTVVTNLNSDMLDGQHGSYYLDWANVTNKPDPIITLAGDLTGSVTLTDLASGTLTATIAANSVALGTDTTGNYVSTVGVSGNGLSISGAAGEGSTFTVDSNATSLNTASTLVYRDASGNFSAGTITAALTGNASTATKLQTSRLINGVGFDGSANITVADSTKLPLAGGTLTGALVVSGATAEIYHSTAQASLELTGNGTDNYSLVTMWNSDYSKYWAFAHRGPSGGQNTFRFEYFNGTSYLAPLSIGIDGVTTLTGLVASGGVKETKISMAANDIDINAGNYFTKTITVATTFTVSNVPVTGTAASFILDLTDGGAFIITWWTGVKWAGGTAPTLTAAGRDVLGFFTHDGGTTWTGLVLGKDIK